MLAEKRNIKAEYYEPTTKKSVETCKKLNVNQMRNVWLSNCISLTSKGGE